MAKDMHNSYEKEKRINSNICETTAENRQSFNPRLTLFGYVDGVSQEFASFDETDVVTTTGQGADVHVFVRTEPLPSCIRTHKASRFRVCSCENRQRRPRRGLYTDIRSNLSIDTQPWLVDGCDVLRDQREMRTFLSERDLIRLLLSIMIT